MCALNYTRSKSSQIGKGGIVSIFVPGGANTLTMLSSRLARLRALGFNKWDSTAVKNFSLTEGVRFDLRAEFYNAFNMTELGTPNTTVTSQSFGRITRSSSWRQIQLLAKPTF